jgi:FHA domain
MIDIVLLVLKIGILVLLYLFIWQVVRTAVRSVRGAGAAATPATAAPDVALPAGDRLAPVFTPAERDQRREEREAERTMDGQKMDFSAHINPRLVVEDSPIVPSGVVFPLKGWITVGRAAASDIVLDEQFVSSTHARLVPRGQFYYVEDLGSTNGTFVNEKPVTEAQLKMDSRVRIGETTFRYEE